MAVLRMEVHILAGLFLCTHLPQLFHCLSGRFSLFKRQNDYVNTQKPSIGTQLSAGSALFVAHVPAALTLVARKSSKFPSQSTY